MDTKALLEKYNQGFASAAETKQIEDLISIGEISMEQLLDHKNLMDGLEESMETSLKTDQSFLSSLEEIESPQVQTKNTKAFFWIPILAILSILSIWYMNTNSEQPNHIEEPIQYDFAAAFQDSKNSNEKIKLVASTNLNNQEDSKIIDALFFALNYDKSTNVRLACIQTLSTFSDQEKVRTGLINSIINQKSALVLNHIAEVINTGGDTMTKEDFQERINKDLPYPVMQSIEENFIKI